MSKFGGLPRGWMGHPSNVEPAKVQDQAHLRESFKVLGMQEAARKLDPKEHLDGSQET